MAGAPNAPASVSLGAEGTSPGVEKSKGMRPEGDPGAMRPEPEADSAGVAGAAGDGADVSGGAPGLLKSMKPGVSPGLKAGSVAPNPGV